MKWQVILAINLFVPTLVQAEEKIELPTISVNAKKDALSDQRISNTQKQVLSRQDIENLGVMTIGEVLGKLPGVEVGGINTDGSAVHRARGMSRDSVDIRIDGERPAGGSRIVSGVIGRLPSGDLERVEILRGSSAEFGGSASVTVNLVMKKALPKQSTAVKAAVGLNQAMPTGQFTLTKNGGEGGFSWSVPVTLNLHRTPSEREMSRQDSVSGVRTLWEQEQEDGLQSFREFVVTPRFTWKSGRDSLTISPLLFDGLRRRVNETDLSSFTNPADGTGLVSDGERNSRERNHRSLMRLRTEGEKYWGAAKLSGRLAFNTGKNTSDLTRKTRDTSNVLTTAIEASTNYEREFNSALRWDQSVENHYLSVAAEYVRLTRDDEQDYAGTFVANNRHEAKANEQVVWIQDEWSPQESLTLTAGLRSENMRLHADAESQQHHAWLPSLAMRWDFSEGWVARTSVGGGMKLPRLDEISNAMVRSVSTNTPVEADRRGNPDLEPERSLNFEAVLEHYLAQETGVVGANVYVRSTRDFTERRVQLEGTRWIDRPYNVGDALHWGVEFDAKVKMDALGWKGATAKTHLTLPRARVDDDFIQMRRMARDTPDYILSMGWDQSLPKLDSSYGVSLQLSGRSETDVPTEQQGYTESRMLLDAYWLYKLSPQFNLRISGQNLLGEDFKRQNTYMSGSNAWRLNTEDMGNRSLLVTLEGRW